jgi:cytochrome bd-type quinol oxidase subunit 2
MNKLNYWIQKYLMWVMPLVAATMVWGHFQSDSEIRSQGSPALTALWEMMSGALIIWFLCLFAFMILLAFRKDTQEATIKHLAGADCNGACRTAIFCVDYLPPYFLVFPVLLYSKRSPIA